MSTLDPRIRALVDAARAAEPTVADRTRVRDALALRLGAGAIPGGAPRVSAPAPVASTAARAGASVKLLVASVLIGAAGFTVSVFATKGDATTANLARHGVEAQARRRAWSTGREGPNAATNTTAKLAEMRSAAPLLPPPVERPTPVLIPEALAPPPRSLGIPASPFAEARPASRSAVAPRPSVSPSGGSDGAGEGLGVGAPGPRTSSLIEETQLLRAAQTSLGAGDATAALARLDELGARHPDGLLREERLAARVATLCAAGREDEARREAARFLAEVPLSIHAARVRASCAFAGQR
jgi:hypothetical protein